jgi:hypothetical protein
MFDVFEFAFCFFNANSKALYISFSKFEQAN